MKTAQSTGRSCDVPTDRSRSQEVYLQLKRDIVEFRLLPGERLTEHEQSARLGVSRTPVRQALYRLQQEGHVEVFFRSGWRVLPFDFRRYEQLYELRIILEQAAIHALCQGLASSQQELVSQLAPVWWVPESSRSRDGKTVGQWDEDFHSALVDATGNLEMMRVHREISEKIRLIRRLDFEHPHRLAATYDEHAQILEAISSQDSQLACQVLKDHITHSQAEVRNITLHQLHQVQRER